MIHIRIILARLMYIPTVFFLIVGALFSAFTVFLTSTAIMCDHIAARIAGEKDNDH